MPRYAIIGTHEASQCPGANGTMQGVWKKVMEQVPALRDKHGIKSMFDGPIHLNPAHKFLNVVEAPSAEAVIAFLMESRLAQIQNMEVWPTTPIAELFQQAETSPPLF